jgi:hypothetical protein
VVNEDDDCFVLVVSFVRLLFCSGASEDDDRFVPPTLPTFETCFGASEDDDRFVPPTLPTFETCSDI